MTITELRARLDAIVEERRTIHTGAGDADLNDEQQTRWDELDTEENDLRAQLATAEEAEARAERVRQSRSRFGADYMRKVEPFQGDDVRSLPRHELRDRSLALVGRDSDAGHLSERQRAHLERALRGERSRNHDPAYIARRMLITETPAYRSAFMKLSLRTSPVLTPDEARAIEAFDELRAMSLTDANGGYGVPVLIDPTIVLTGQESPNDILNIARVETITNDEWKGVSSAGVSWSFDAEGAAVSDDSPTLAQPTVPVHTARGFVPFSIEIGMDYPGFASEMSTLLSAGYSELVAEKVTTGSGSGEPTGIVTALDANTNVEVTPTTDGAFGAVDLYRLWDALPIKYRRRDSTAWLSSTDVQNEARNFGATLGSNFTVDLTEEAIPRLFGRRYYVNDFMADFTGSTGSANLLIVGDWKNFLVAQRAGMSVELVPHLVDVTNNRPTGQRGWFAWARIGSDSINDLGFRMLQNQ